MLFQVFFKSVYHRVQINTSIILYKQLGRLRQSCLYYFCPPPFTPLDFNQPTFRLEDVVCVEDFCAKDKDKEIYEALKKMQ